MFKRAPVSFASAGQGGGVAASMSMGSLAKSLNAYDDEDDDEPSEEEAEASEEEAEASETTSKGGSRPPDMYSRYGIGAQLMMKMGYQHGKGLGARQEGIVSPIETKMRPQGLGVGGVSERGASERSEPVDSSDDDDAPVRYDVYGEIQRLERLGASVPLKYKQVCDHMDTLEPSAVAEAYRQLSAYARELQDAVQEEQYVEHELQAARNEIGATERDLAASERILAALESHSAADPASVQSTLQKLQDASLPDASIDLEAVFVSVVADCVSHCGEDALAKWRQMYTPLAKRSEGLCQWDWLLLQQRIVPSYQAAAAEDRVDVLSAWQNRQDLLVDPELVVQELIRGNVEPQLHQAIDEWAESGDSSRRVLYVVEYLPFVGGEPLVARVHQWFVELCHHVYTQRHSDELALLERFWRPLFAQYGLSEDAITKALVTASLRAVRPDTATVATLLSLSPFIGSEPMLLLMQFKVFNPWLLDLNARQPEAAVQYKSWYNWWVAHRHEVDRAHMQPMVEWNLSVGLAHLASGRPMALPAIAGQDAPADDAIGSAIESIGATSAAVDAAAVPSYRLLTSFKDVVQQYCAQHDILFSVTAQQLHRPLYRLQRDDKSLVCYIEEDVLWIKRTHSYEPVSLHELSACF
ncbi:G-patch domain-containing protein [[Candida] zeylanoides]